MFEYGRLCSAFLEAHKMHILLYTAYLSCDGSVEGRTLFLTVSGSQRRIEEMESDADLNTARWAD